MTLFEREKTSLQSLDYIFCSDDYLLTINKNFLNHDDFTDIITFNLSSDDTVMGEIYISIERVRENARTFDIPFPQELSRVVFHGSLHLCGYLDKTAKDKVLIRAKEDEYIEYHIRETTRHLSKKRSSRR